MTSATLKWLPFSMLLLLTACATVPNGPSVMVLPGTGKNFDQFHSDDIRCRHFALEQVGGAPPSQTASQDVVASAVTGTAVGAVAGAVIGGDRGAAAGAGAGLLFGTLVGSETGQSSAYYSQQRYDNSYIQCMYANGHLVPMPGGMYMNTRDGSEETAPMPPPAPAYLPPTVKIPPPPPGPPPPPPPGR